MSDCTHGMPSPASCVDCMAEGNMAPPPKAEPEWADSHTFGSKYDGDCPSCNLGIHVGQLIVHTTRDRYVHVGCVSRAR